jgi:hypothetical protein
VKKEKKNTPSSKFSQMMSSSKKPTKSTRQTEKSQTIANEIQQMILDEKELLTTKSLDSEEAKTFIIQLREKLLELTEKTSSTRGQVLATLLSSITKKLENSQSCTDEDEYRFYIFSYFSYSSKSDFRDKCKEKNCDKVLDEFLFWILLGYQFEFSNAIPLLTSFDVILEHSKIINPELKNLVNKWDQLIKEWKQNPEQYPNEDFAELYKDFDLLKMRWFHLYIYQKLYEIERKHIHRRMLFATFTKTSLRDLKPKLKFIIELYLGTRKKRQESELDAERVSYNPSSRQRPLRCTEQESSSPTEQESSSLAEQRSSSLAEQRSSSPTEKKSSSLAEQRSSSPTEKKSSSLAEQRSSSPTEHTLSSKNSIETRVPGKSEISTAPTLLAPQLSAANREKLLQARQELDVIIARLEARIALNEHLTHERALQLTLEPSSLEDSNSIVFENNDFDEQPQQSNVIISSIHNYLNRQPPREKSLYQLLDEPDSDDPYKRYGLLKTAIEVGDPIMIEDAIGIANVNTKIDIFGNSPLTYAASLSNNVESIRTLLELKADVNDENNNGKTALMLSQDIKNEAAANLLLENGAATEYDVDRVRDAESGNTSLGLAALEGNLTSIKELIRKGANVNYTNDSGKTVLMLSAERGDSDAVDLLLKNGADPDIQDLNGKTARDLSHPYLDIDRIMVSRLHGSFFLYTHPFPVFDCVRCVC